MIEVIARKFFFRNIRIGAMEGGTITIWVKEMHNAAHQIWLPGHTAWVPGSCHRARAGTVIRPIASEDLVPARIPTRQFDGILICVRTTKGEQDLAQLSIWGDICNRLARQRADFGG